MSDDWEAIQLADWNWLVQLPSVWSSMDIQRTFYPDTLVDALIDSSSARRPNFLAKLDAEAYYRVYQIILQSPHLHFPDIQRILRVGRAQGKTVSSLMAHIGQWLNPVPNTSNKVQLWRGLLPESIENRDGEARILQSEIFNLVRDRTDELTSTLLTQLPKDAKDSYLERFQLPIWRDILIAVHRVIGPRFQGVLGQFNTQDPAGLPVQKESTLIQAVRDAISHIPYVARNPALRSDPALTALICELSPAITAWAVQHCDTALREQILGRTPSWPASVRELVKCQLGELKGTVSSSSHVKEPTSFSAVPIIRPESRQSERYDGEGAVKDMVEDVLQDVPTSSANADGSDQSEGPTSKETMAENPRAELHFLDALPSLEEMKKRHRQVHSARRAKGNPGQPSKDVKKAPRDERINGSLCVQSPAVPVYTSIAKAKAKKKASWMDSPAAQGGSKGLH